MRVSSCHKIRLSCKTVINASSPQLYNHYLTLLIYVHLVFIIIIMITELFSEVVEGTIFF